MKKSTPIDQESLWALTIRKKKVIIIQNGKDKRSIYRALNALRCKYLARRVLKSVDLGRFEKIRERYQLASPDPGYSKYLDIQKWIEINLRNYYSLGLHHVKPIKVLDIGTGCGYFPYICNYYGHQSIGIDVDEVPMYNEITRFLKIDRRIWRINAYEALPDFGTKFHLITAFLVCFNNHDTQDVWGKNEWDCFLNDLLKNQLYESGSVFLTLNAERNGQYYDDALFSFFLEKGARINQGRIYLEKALL